MINQTTPQTGSTIVAELDILFKASVARLRSAISAFVKDGVAPEPAARGTAVRRVDLVPSGSPGTETAPRTRAGSARP